MYSFFYNRHEIICSEEQADRYIRLANVLLPKINHLDLPILKSLLNKQFSKHICYYPECRSLTLDNKKVATRSQRPFKSVNTPNWVGGSSQLFIIALILIILIEKPTPSNDFGIIYTHTNGKVIDIY